MKNHLPNSTIQTITQAAKSLKVRPLGAHHTAKAPTFCDLHIFLVSGQGTVDLPNKLHVVQQGIKCIEVGEADLVSYGTSSSLK